MTRILFWNLMNFSSNTIANNNASAMENFWKLNYILKTVNDPNYGPHIFALIELPPGPRSVQGELVTKGKSYAGIKILQTQLGNDWDLVPPIATGTGGKREGIAVFFKHATVSFEGPWFFCPRTGQTKEADGVAGWKGTYKGTHWYNPKSTVGEYGGQWGFKDNKGNTVEFPNDGERRPWRTLFQEKQGAKRYLDIISFHAPFGGGPVKGVQALHKAIDVNDDIKDGYVRILGGDFNVHASNNNQRKQAYKPFQEINFTGEFLSPFIVKNCKGRDVKRYCRTSLRETGISKISMGTYQHYDYSANWYDHIFTKYALGKRPPKTSPMVLNPVTGVDIGNAGPPPNKNSRKGYGYAAKLPPQGSVQNVTYPTSMAISIENIFGLAPLFGGSEDQVFRNFYNYGHIRRTSDHMGVVVDV